MTCQPKLILIRANRSAYWWIRASYFYIVGRLFAGTLKVIFLIQYVLNEKIHGSRSGSFNSESTHALSTHLHQYQEVIHPQTLSLRTFQFHSPGSIGVKYDPANSGMEQFDHGGHHPANHLQLTNKCSFINIQIGYHFCLEWNLKFKNRASQTQSKI